MNELNKQFQTHLTDWLNNYRCCPPPEAGELRCVITEIYAELELPAPVVIRCESPIQRIAYPLFVDKIIGLGQVDGVTPKLDPLDSGEYLQLSSYLRQIWKDAYRAINWNLVVPGAPGNGEPIGARIFHYIDNHCKNTLVAMGDLELGFDAQEELHKQTSNILRHPLTRMRLAFNLPEPEQQSLRRSITLRLKNQKKRNRKQGGRNNEFLGLLDFLWFPVIDFAHTRARQSWDAGCERLFANLKLLLQSALGFEFFEHCCFVFLKPTSSSFDDSWRLHSQSSAALEFCDGTMFYYWHGVEVPEQVVLRPHKIKLKDIFAEPNAEVRRVLVERYGYDNFCMVARKIQEDEYGALFYKDMPGDEPWVVVKVQNSTAEPDGSFKKYFLRVPPDTLTAKQGIAWTFGMEEDEYFPVEES
ncbi:MAG TPA: hypothetical protein V6C97_31320 [Oculatellaceae cyanobacterium]